MSPRRHPHRPNRGRSPTSSTTGRKTPLGEAVKIGFLSFDASIRSNLAVGRPLDLMVLPNKPGGRALVRRVGLDDAYFNDLSARWGDLLNNAAAAIPDPPFMAEIE